ncbi:MAG: hypothetical protein HETSPECPRED_007909 [Heterodermia speciosa]|uniref:Uncharacterized protein n=1 Tax=Heterodermia speciosa TaxID=116794 RepID=A0A8H3I7H4_9LECA|nr:MAG: hypothetical protein HETSPECPRED_007909 [Heterodermia speciosa]
MNSTLDGLTHLGLPLSPLRVSSLGDWESFVYPIPANKQTLKGRIFTTQPIRPSALHFAIDGALASTQWRIAQMGDVRLEDTDNPYIYRVPGCYFKMESKIVEGKAMLTYGMLVAILKALEHLLEENEQSFNTGFVLVDDEKRTWGHGEIFDKPPSPPSSVA